MIDRHILVSKTCLKREKVKHFEGNGLEIIYTHIKYLSTFECIGFALFILIF